MPIKNALVDYIKKPKDDEFVTPREAVYPILKYIPPNIKTIWECADCGKSGIRNVLLEKKLQCCFDL